MEKYITFFFKKVLFIYFLAALGLYRCSGFSPIMASDRYSLVAVQGLLFVDGHMPNAPDSPVRP